MDLPGNIVEYAPARVDTGTLRAMIGQYLKHVVVGVLLSVVMSGGGAKAQKPGGVLRIYHRDSPASMSIHEEATNSVSIPMMGVFNNLVLYDQHVAQNSLDTIVPDLAESWSWNEDGTRLTFKLRQGVKWHDGKPFTSADVKCTWDLLTGRATERLRLNPRKSWWNNVAEIATDGPAEATFVLKRPQPAILALIASGYTPIYPCHVPPRDMRQHPIGTGPFKFVEFKPNESIKLVRNPDYWKTGAALSRRHRIHDHPEPLDRDPRLHRRQVRPDLSLRGHDPGAEGRQSASAAGGVRSRLDQCQHQSFGQPRGAALRQSRAAARPGVGARPQELYRYSRRGTGRYRRGDAAAAGRGLGHAGRFSGTIPGYAPDVAKNRAEAREIMTKLGYGPDKRLAIKVAARNIPTYRDPAMILIDQLKEIWIDGELEPVETANWFPKLARKDYQIGLNNTGSGVDDPDQQFFENYGCGSERNYTGYCNAELEKLFVEQSTMADREKRRQLVWEIDKKLQEDGARPIIYHARLATCMQPQSRG